MLFKRTALQLVKQLTRSNHHHVCIVGSGPAGFYVAQHLLKLRSTSPVKLKIDVVEKLPVPFGLVRYGVAPDHPEVKNVINSFNTVLQHENVRFVGNVEAGKEFQLNDLVKSYHAVVLCYGATSDRLLGIPNENLVTSAREFVGWYNGLPYNSSLPVNLHSWTRALIIGHGNVALDIGRILLTPPAKLENTDIAPYALDALKQSSVKEVIIVGRRGVLQVQFTIKEFREMLKLDGVGWGVQLDRGVSQETLDTLPRPRKRLTELIMKSANEPKQCAKNWTMKFVRSPVEVNQLNNHLAVRFQVNRMEGDRAVPTDKYETIACDVAFRSIGYKGSRVFSDVPFDEQRGVVVNDNGRVARGVYCSGWAGQGPRGVILSTMQNSFEVAKMVSQDLDQLGGESKSGFESFYKLFSGGKKITNYSDYLSIAAWEVKHGKKITDVNQMIGLCS